MKGWGFIGFDFFRKKIGHSIKRSSIRNLTILRGASPGVRHHVVCLGVSLLGSFDVLQWFGDPFRPPSLVKIAGKIVLENALLNKKHNLRHFWHHSKTRRKARRFGRKDVVRIIFTDLKTALLCYKNKCLTYTKSQNWSVWGCAKIIVIDITITIVIAIVIDIVIHTAYFDIFLRRWIFLQYSIHIFIDISGAT